MTILSSLVKAYDRLPNAPPFGYSVQGILYCLVLDLNGRIVGDPVALGPEAKGRVTPRPIVVPYFGGRSGSKAPPYFLWDNSAYVLGVSGKGYDAERRFSSFKEYHLDALAEAKTPEVCSVLAFLKWWEPLKFHEKGFPDAMLDRNIVFRFEGERRFVHESIEAKKIWENLYSPDVLSDAICLISGERTPIARLHPPIGTFENPARIVSFDKDNDAFSSYNHVQAENAPTGIEAAFKYTAVLNHFLSRSSGHRIQIGDASTVFWADASDMDVASYAEAWGSLIFDADEMVRGEDYYLTKDIRY